MTSLGNNKIVNIFPAAINELKKKKKKKKKEVRFATLSCMSPEKRGVQIQQLPLRCA